MSKVCRQCGKRFYMAPKGSSAYVGPRRFMRRRFCTLQCATLAKRRPPRQEGHPCPLCGKLLTYGGNHFVRVHRMTAAEVRQATGQPTIAPETSRLLGVEIGERNGQRRWPDHEMIYALREFYRRASYAPSAHAWRRSAASHPCSSLYLRRFGSWNAALHAAGLPTRAPGEARRPSGPKKGRR